jgi:hypothetical protein
VAEVVTVEKIHGNPPTGALVEALVELNNMSNQKSFLTETRRPNMKLKDSTNTPANRGHLITFLFWTTHVLPRSFSSPSHPPFPLNLNRFSVQTRSVHPRRSLTGSSCLIPFETQRARAA